MNAQSEAFEDEYEEYDEFDDDEEERGLSGLVVLLMGVVMLGAFAAVVWIAYQQGIKSGADGRTVPTVVADPEPVKIENDVADAAAAADRPVYDRIANGETASTEILAEAPEEPVTRDVEDPIAAIAAETADAGGEVVDDAVADRIASLAEADAAAETAVVNEPVVENEPEPVVANPAPAVTQPQPAPTTSAGANALSGSHLVQVGAFRSQEEADGFWSRLEARMADYVGGKAPDVERADLGDRGVFYRLRIGPFSSSDAAKTYCEGLKSRGQDCLVKAK